MNRRNIFVPLVAGALLLAGCQNGDPGSAKKDNKEEIVAGKTISTSDEVELPSTTAEEYIQAGAGDFYKEYIEGKEFEEDGEVYEKASGEAVDTYIKEIEKKNPKKWDAIKWADSLMGAFSADYGPIASELEKYEVVFEELKLPDGRLLQDVSMDEITANESKKVNVVLVIDSSGSMKAKVDGEAKMALAKKSVEDLAKGLPENVNVSVVAFGHKGTGSDADKAKSCSAVETVYPLKPFDSGAFTGSLAKFDSSGWTPLAASISLANQQLATVKEENTENFIYVVSDGIETCDGDPVAAAKKAVQDHTNVKINIIGFDVDDAADKQLKQVAEAGGGDYSSVKTKQQLTEIKDVWKEAININTWRWWAVHSTSDNVWTSLDHYNALDGNEIKVFYFV